MAHSSRLFASWLLVALAAATTLSGCAHVHPAPAAGVRPTLPSGADLEYALELEQRPFTTVRVELSFVGAVEGKTTLRLSTEWGGVEDPQNEMHKLEARDDRGRLLPLRHPESGRWEIDHRPNAVLHVSYYLVSTVSDTPYSSTESNVYYRPIVNEEMIHVIGTVAFVHPDWDGESPRRIALKWQGFARAGWTVVSSFSTAQDGFVETVSLDDFRHAVFLAARDLRILTKEVQLRPVHFAVVGGGWRFADADLADLGARVFYAERAFFGDYDYPYYLVTLIPVGAQRKKGTSTGGTGLHNTFALFMTPNIELAGYTGMRVKHLLAHELFHQWNGRIVRREDPEAAVYWFSEGFTDFYTGRLLYRAGLLSLSEYVDLLNEEIEEYQTSPLRNAPNDRIVADFWKSHAAQRLPYRRGEFVAWLTDAEMRRKTNNALSLDAIMQDIVAAARQAGERTNTDKLLARIARWTSPAFADRVRKIVVDGATAELPADIAAPCLKLETIEKPQFDLGFDFEKSKEAHRVTGLRPDSAAYAAGVREGQRLRQWSVFWDDVAKPVELAVVENEGDRLIRFYPLGAKRRLPRFTVNQPDACAARL